MSNQHGQPGADPAGSQPTEPLWAGSEVPAALSAGGEQAGPGPTGNPLPGPAGHGVPGPVGDGAPGPHGTPKQGHGKALSWTVGVLVAALLAGGGTLAGMKLAGHSSPGASAAAPGQAGTVASAQQGALLNETLSDAASPGQLTTAAGATLAGGAAAVAGPAAKAPVCARAQGVARVARRARLPRLARRIGAGAAHCRLVRRRVFAFFLLRGVDGQFTVQGRNGTKTLAFERGVITSVTAGKSIVIKASDGTTWTWDLVSTTVIRDGQGKAGQSALTTGTAVWAGGPVVQGVKDARLIVLRPPQPAPAPPSSTPGN